MEPLEGFTLTRIFPTILPQLDNKQFAVAGKSTEQAIVCKKKKYLFIPFLKSDYILTYNFVGFLATRNNRIGLKIPSGQILNLALEALDKGNCSLRVFFADICKGFELIDHKILLAKLSKLNIHNSMLRWIGAFPLERSRCVRIDNSRSIAQNINGGIHQGTKLAPILFAVMVNDLISTWGPRIKRC
jgi:hypothetical protein